MDQKWFRILFAIIVIASLGFSALGTPAYADDVLPPTEAPAEVVIVDEPIVTTEEPATFVQMLVEVITSWVGPSDQSVEDLTDLEDSNGNGLHGDVDCVEESCEKIEGDDLPAPDSNNETVIPFTEIDGNVVVIHAGGGANEIVIDLNSGDECDQSPEGDAFCASKFQSPS